MSLSFQGKEGYTSVLTVEKVPVIDDINGVKSIMQPAHISMVEVYPPI